VYAVWVDEKDGVWLSDWSESALLRFDPATERFERGTDPGSYANVRQILGRPGETWGAESGNDRLVRVTR
jgi:virginiamycin B lyase